MQLQCTKSEIRNHNMEINLKLIPSLLARRAEILPQKVVGSGKTRRSKSLLSQLHLMAIAMLYCAWAKLQSSLKGSYSFFLINLTKLIVLAVLITFGFLWEYKWNSFMLHIICTILYNAQPLHYADFFLYPSFCLWNEGTYPVIRLLQAEFLKPYLNFPVTEHINYVIFWNLRIQHTSPGFLNRAHAVEVAQFPFLVANIQTNRNSIVLSWIAKVHKLKCKELNLKLLHDFIFLTWKQDYIQFQHNNFIDRYPLCSKWSISFISRKVAREKKIGGGGGGGIKTLEKYWDKKKTAHVKQQHSLISTRKAYYMDIPNITRWIDNMTSDWNNVWYNNLLSFITKSFRKIFFEYTNVVYIAKMIQVFVASLWNIASFHLQRKKTWTQPRSVHWMSWNFQ